VIDPARVVSAARGVDHVAVLEREEKGVIRIVRIARRQLHRIVPRHVFARVFDDALAFPDRRDRVDAFAMHA
jgi:hypothetical protein